MHDPIRHGLVQEDHAGDESSFTELAGTRDPMSSCTLDYVARPHRPTFRRKIAYGSREEFSSIGTGIKRDFAPPNSPTTQRISIGRVWRNNAAAPDVLNRSVCSALIGSNEPGGPIRTEAASAASSGATAGLLQRGLKPADDRRYQRSCTPAGRNGA